MNIKAKNTVPVWYLHKMFSYDGETGLLRRKVKVPGIQKEFPGWINLEGYRRVRVGGTSIDIHRIAYAMTYGFFPPPGSEIDHIDGDRLNNKIANIRLVTSRENNWNKKTNRDGRLVGATRISSKYELKKPWFARVGYGKETKYLGVFATEQEAHEAYRRALEAPD